MTAPELKPCPFCGAVDPEWLASHVVCDCGATGPRQDVDREYQADAMRALTDWNRHADLAAVQPAQVRVKPLVWDDGTNNRKYAKSEIGQYSAREFSIDNVRLDLDGKLLAGSFNTIKAAKAAAQADYEARILAALEPLPDQTVEIDLRVAMMEELEKAASESPWVPKEYYMNEVISDCCAFLREDRTPQGDYFEGLEEGIKIGRGEPQPISKSADLHDPRDEVIARLVEALTKMRALMCEAIEDDDGNSGCGQCVNDCTGCIAHAALAAAKAVQK